MQKTMRGIVKAAAGPGLEFRTDLPVPEIGEDEVLMKIRCASICGTDLGIYNWGDWARRRMTVFPRIIGHETTGEIVAVGSRVKDRFVGQRVSVETHMWDGTCPHCLAGRRHVCQNMTLYGIQTDGAFAEYSKVRADVTYVLADELSDEQGCVFEPMGSGVHGVEEADVAGKTVLVAGCGAIGLTVVAACRVFKAKTIIACDLYDEKLEAARAMGADVTINSRREDLVARVLELTHGLGVEAAIDVTGSPAALNSSLKCVMAMGCLVSVGLPGEPVTMDMTEDLFYRQIHLSGICGRRIWETWDDFTTVLKDPIYDMKRVIGGQFALEDFEAGFAKMRSGAPGKMFLYP